MSEGSEYLSGNADIKTRYFLTSNIAQVLSIFIRSVFYEILLNLQSKVINILQMKAKRQVSQKVCLSQSST